MALKCPYRIIFLRHGETDWNVTGRFQGQRDTPLNPLGREQAAGAGRMVKTWLGTGALAQLAEMSFIASPLERTRMTMEIARTAIGLPPKPYDMDDRLKELSFGTWEGLVWREVVARDGDLARARDADKWGFCPPEGESYLMLSERIKPWVQSLSGDMFVVSHGGVARALMYLIGGIGPLEAPTADIWQGRPLIFEEGACRWL